MIFIGFGANLSGRFGSPQQTIFQAYKTLEKQGVRLINIKDDDSIAAVAKVMNDEDEIQDVDDIDVTIEDNNDNS